MTLDLVPEIDALANCRTHQERAQFLLTCPLNKLSHYEMTIRNRLRIAGFLAGIEYLELELWRWRSERYFGEPFTDAPYLASLRYLTATALGTLPAADGPPTQI